MQLTDLQKRILQAMPTSGFILLRTLANSIDMSGNQVRVQVRKLEAMGCLKIAEIKHSGVPMQIKLVTLFPEVKPNFDKLLINTRWV